MNKHDEGDFMRLQISKSKNAESFYVVRSVYEKGKRSSVIYEKLGTLQKVKERAGGQEPHEWAKACVMSIKAAAISIINIIAMTMKNVCFFFPVFLLIDSSPHPASYCYEVSLLLPR